MENLEPEKLKFTSIGDFLVELKRKLGRGDDELTKIWICQMWFILEERKSLKELAEFNKYKSL